MLREAAAYKLAGIVIKGGGGVGQGPAVHPHRVEGGVDLGPQHVDPGRRGLPVGGDLEYADELTLGRALEGRRELHG